MFRAVGKRCAVNFAELEINIPKERCLEILTKIGFRVIEPDIIAFARDCIGSSLYCRSVHWLVAPMVVDCSSFTKWIYGKRGIWLPRRSIQQREFGTPIPLEEAVPGDLIFVRGYKNYYHDRMADGVGHVGITTGQGTVIHAANREDKVIEVPIDSFIRNDNFRGVRRYVIDEINTITLLTPPKRDVETSDDIKWIILQNV